MTQKQSIKHLRIKLEEFNPQIAMTILPAAIQYKRRLEQMGGVSVRITSNSHWLQQFLYPYQEDRRSSPHIKMFHEEELIGFPLETYQQTVPRITLKQAIATSFNVDVNMFFTNAGFPETSRGVFQERLYVSRLSRRHGFYVYYVPLFPEQESPDSYDVNFWSKFVRFFYDRSIATLTAESFLPNQSINLITTYSLVNMLPEEQRLWRIVTDLLLCKFFVGGRSILSELAMLLDVPCIILPSSYQDNFPLEIKHNVQYVKLNDYGGYLWEDFADAYRNLEGLFLLEH